MKFATARFAFGDLRSLNLMRCWLLLHQHKFVMTTQPAPVDHTEEIGFQQIREAFGPRFKHFRLLTNLVIPMPDAHVPTAELDAVVVCDAGVFIFEIKGHRNCLIEREDANQNGHKRWFAVPERRETRSEIPDPLRQNAPKRARLRELVPEPIKLNHYVLFPMPDVRLEPTMPASVLTATDLDYVARMLRANNKGIKGWHQLDEAEVRQTETMLLSLQGGRTKTDHIENCKAIFGEGRYGARPAESRPIPISAAVSPTVGERAGPCTRPASEALPMAAAKDGGFAVPVEALKWLSIGVGLATIGALSWDLLAERHVSSSEAIGKLQHLGAGGLDASAILETANGFYPIRGSAAFQKGADLVLEMRGNGKRFVCDAGRKACVPAAEDTLAATPAAE